MFTAYGIGALIGMPISGRLRDVLGSYTYTFYPMIALVLIGVILVGLTLKNLRRITHQINFILI